MNLINDTTTELKPGMIVTAQLGNAFDTSWSPCAPLLLLHTNAVLFGEQQFTGLYQRANGEYFVARFVQKHHDRADHQASTQHEIGIVYCTSGVPMDLELAHSSYLSEAENQLLANALFHHRFKIRELPVAKRYRRDELLAEGATL